MTHRTIRTSRFDLITNRGARLDNAHNIMPISEIITQLEAIKSTHGDVPVEVKLQLKFLGSHACGAVIDLRYRSPGIGKPFVQLIAQEKS